MIQFSCKACGQPLLLAQVGSWLLGEPFCAQQCAERVDQEALRARAPTAEQHLAAMPGLLSETDTFLASLVQLAEQAHQAEQRVDAVDGPGSVLGRAVVGSIVGGVVRGTLESAALDRQDHLHAQFATLDAIMSDLVRRTMALHAAGYSAPPATLQAVRLSESLDASHPYAVSFQAKQMRKELRLAIEHMKRWDDSPYR